MTLLSPPMSDEIGPVSNTVFPLVQILGGPGEARSRSVGGVCVCRAGIKGSRQQRRDAVSSSWATQSQSRASALTTAAAPAASAPIAIMVLIWTQFGVKHKNVKCKVRVIHGEESWTSEVSGPKICLLKFLHLFI